MRNGIAACAFLLAGAAQAAPLRARATLPAGTVPGGINWQASLLQNGVPVTGAVSLDFRIFDAPTGGNLLWDGGAQTVACAAGLCSAAFAPPVSALAGGGVYLEIAANGAALRPRASLSAVPYALMAKTLDGSLDISGGGLTVSSSAFGASVLFVSSQTGKVGIGATNPAYTLDLQGDLRSTGTVAAGLLSTPVWLLTGASFAAGSALSVGASRTGMGTAAPDQALTVSGNASLAGSLISSGSAASFFSGSVGVGRASPQSKLQVLDGDIRLSTTAGEIRGIYFEDGTFMNSAAVGSVQGLTTLSPADAAVVSDGLGANVSALVRLRSGSSDIAAVTDAGLVGVGTLSPGAQLDVNGSSQFGAGPAKSTFTALGDLQLSAGSTITSRGTLSISTAASAQTTGVPAIFLTTGSVGFGTLAPAATVHAAGDIDSDGTFYVGGAGPAMKAAHASVVELGAESVYSSNFVAGAAAPRLTAAFGGNVGVSSASPAAFFTVANGTMIVTSGGRIGIGVAAPLASLHVASAAVTIDGTNPGILVGGGILAASGGPAGAQVGIGNPAPTALFEVAAGTLTALAGGNVGVGTASPATALDVAGGVVIGSGTARTSLGSSGSFVVAGNLQAATLNHGLIPPVYAPLPGVLTADGSPSLASSSQPGLLVSPNLFVVAGSSVGVGTVAPGAMLHMSSGSLIVDGTGAGFSLGGSNLVVSGSNVGVGTSNPATLLHVSNGVVTVDGAGAALSAGGGAFTVAAGGVGIGTGRPAAALHLSSGTLLLDGLPGSALSVGGAGFNASPLGVGVGSTAPPPGVLLDVGGAARFGGPAKALFDAGGNLALPSGAVVASSGTLTLSPSASASPASVLGVFIDGAGRVGVGGTSTGTLLSVGQPLLGSAASSVLRTNAGSLGAGPDLGLASFGFATGNSESFSVRAARVSAGADWTTTALSLGMDVDNTLRAGAAVWLSTSGNVGVGTSFPASLLTVQDGDLQFSATRGTAGIRFSDGSYQTTSGAPVAGQWANNGTSIYETAVGNVGIGTGGPSAKAHVVSGGQTELDLQNLITGGTPAGGSHWGLFADNAGGAGGNLTFGVNDAANAALRWGIDNSGKVGVGTTAPGVPLDAAGAGTFGIRYIRNAADARIGVGDFTTTWTAGSGRYAAGDFAIVNEAGPSLGLYVKQGGNVGLGTTSPANPLHEVGGASAAETVLAYARSNGAGLSTASTLRFANDTAEGSATGGADLAAVRASGSLAGNGDLALRTYSNGAMAEAIRIKANGGVGIGTTSPAAALDVSGDMDVQGQAVRSNFKYVTGFSDWRNNAGCCTNLTWYDIPGRTISYTKTRAGSLLEIVYQDTLGTNGTSYDQCEWQILVDGAAVLFFSTADNQDGASWRMNNAAHAAMASGYAAGSHTIKVQSRRNGATECLQGWNTASLSNLTVEEAGP